MKNKYPEQKALHLWGQIIIDTKVKGTKVLTDQKATVLKSQGLNVWAIQSFWMLFECNAIIYISSWHKKLFTLTLADCLGKRNTATAKCNILICIGLLLRYREPTHCPLYLLVLHGEVIMAPLALCFSSRILKLSVHHTLNIIWHYRNLNAPRKFQKMWHKITFFNTL